MENKIQDRTGSVSKFLRNTKKPLSYWASNSGSVWIETYKANGDPQIANVIIIVGGVRIVYGADGEARPGL